MTSRQQISDSSFSWLASDDTVEITKRLKFRNFFASIVGVLYIWIGQASYDQNWPISIALLIFGGSILTLGIGRRFWHHRIAITPTGVIICDLWFMRHVPRSDIDRIVIVKSRTDALSLGFQEALILQKKSGDPVTLIGQSAIASAEELITIRDEANRILRLDDMIGGNHQIHSGGNVTLEK